MQKQCDNNIRHTLALLPTQSKKYYLCPLINVYLYLCSWWVWVSRYRSRSSRICSEVLHWWGQLGSYWKQHPDFLYQGCASGERHDPHTVHQVPCPNINRICVFTVPVVSVLHPLSETKSADSLEGSGYGLGFLGFASWIVAPGTAAEAGHFCVLSNAENLTHADLRVCAGVFPLQRSGYSGWPPSYERIRIAHFQTSQRSGAASLLQVPL